MPEQKLTFVESEPGRFLLRGDITHETVLSVIDAEMIDVNAKVSVDFSGVNRSDSSGLALMTHWARLAKKANVSIFYEQVPDKLVALAKMSGLDGILSISSG